MAEECGYQIEGVKFKAWTVLNVEYNTSLFGSYGKFSACFGFKGTVEKDTVLKIMCPKRRKEKVSKTWLVFV